VPRSLTISRVSFCCADILPIPELGPDKPIADMGLLGSSLRWSCKAKEEIRRGQTGLREIHVYLLKCGVAVLTGYVSAHISLTTSWLVTIPVAVGVYVAVTLAFMRPLLNEAEMTRRKAWTVGVGAYTSFWLLSLIAFYNLLI
jgi:hypothetical protein